MILAIIFFIIFLILFIHIKIKFKIEYENTKLRMYIYNFEIPLNKKKKSPLKTKKQKRKASKKNFLLSKVSIKPLKLLDSIISNKYKPKLTINNSMKYSLEDAALTAELFGGIHILFYFISSFINLFLNFKPNFKIEPTFSNATYFDIKLDGILSINLAQIIFILFLLLKSLSIKGGNLKGENYGE